MPVDEDDSRIAFLKKELEASLERNNSLERENLELKQEVSRLRAQVSTLKAHDNERKSMLWKKLQYSLESKSPEKSHQKPAIQLEMQEESPVAEKLYEFVQSVAKKGPPPETVPKPPPRPDFATSAPFREAHRHKVASAATPPPPPPPPPPPSKLLVGSRAVHRVPEVIEFYRSLMKRDAQRENKSNVIGGAPPLTNPRNMIGEIENRSTHLLAIKSDVETQGEFIKFLSREVETAGFTEISDVEAFVKWIDGELSCLVDERAVLKHFPQWPERKADALREAAFSFRDLNNLASEVESFKDNPKQQLTQSLRRMQALQDRLERSVSNIERVREGTSKRYRELHIPWKWMLDTGMVGRMKLSSLTLAKEYMKRVAKELELSESSQEEDHLLQGVRFAFRVHQFAGGFDGETANAFEELRNVGTRTRKR